MSLMTECRGHVEPNLLPGEPSDRRIRRLS
jgi:hypothetical protein